MHREHNKSAGTCTPKKLVLQLVFKYMHFKSVANSYTPLSGYLT